MYTVCAWSFLLTDKGCKNWYQAKCFLADSTLLKKLAEFDPKLTNPVAIKNSKKFLSKVDKSKLGQKSACLREIAQWVRSRNYAIWCLKTSENNKTLVWRSIQLPTRRSSRTNTPVAKSFYIDCRSYSTGCMNPIQQKMLHNIFTCI